MALHANFDFEIYICMDLYTFSFQTISWGYMGIKDCIFLVYRRHLKNQFGVARLDPNHGWRSGFGRRMGARWSYQGTHAWVDDLVHPSRWDQMVRGDEAELCEQHARAHSHPSPDAWLRWLEVACVGCLEMSSCCLSQSVGSEDQWNWYLHISNWNEKDDLVHQEANSPYGMHEGLTVSWKEKTYTCTHLMGETNSSAWRYMTLLNLPGGLCWISSDMIHIFMSANPKWCFVLLIPWGRLELLKSKTPCNELQHQNISNIDTILSLFVFFFRI